METDHKQKKIFIGVSWPYAKGNIHIGHLAGQYVVCDVFARYHRLRGNKVLMVSGSDSHGAPVVFRAEQEGVKPEEIVEKAHATIQATYKKLGLLYENYTSTMTKNHEIVAQNIFNALNDFGYLKIQSSKQYYDTKVNRFLPDRFVRGTCPKCGATNARGDECPECGEFLNPEDLIDPYSTLSDTTPVLKETEHFYLDLEKTSSRLSEYLKDKDYWREWVKEFTKASIRDGLKPRAITRDMDFGIPVPVKGWEDKGKVIYVWFEAVIGYLSAAIEWAEKSGNPSAWEDFWKDSECRHYYFIAGGNVPFHTIIWPAELIAYNEKFKDEKAFEKYKLPGETLKKSLNLPFDVPANKMLTARGKKMSQGDDTGISLDLLLNRYNPDLIRYFFIKYAPENHDREFSWKDFIDANNNELVANLGNFINRTISFTNSKFDGIIPEGTLEEEVKSHILNTFNSVSLHIEKCEFVKSIEIVLELGHYANKYFNDGKPWETIKTDPSKTAQTLYNSLQIAYALGTLFKPFLPHSSKSLFKLFGEVNNSDANDELEAKGRVENYSDIWTFNEIKIGTKLQPAGILFEKLEYSEDLQNADATKDTDPESNREVHFEKDPQLKDIPTLAFQVNNLKIKKKKKDLQLWINDHVNQFKIKNVELKGTRGAKELYEKYAKVENPQSIISAPENLMNYIERTGTIPNINTFVDLYNIISLKTGISIGAHDVAKLKGDVKMILLDKDMQFEEINTRNTAAAKKGEFAYLDEKGIICRLDIKQCDRTKVTEGTKSVFIILQGSSEISLDDLNEVREELEGVLSQFLV